MIHMFIDNNELMSLSRKVLGFGSSAWTADFSGSVVEQGTGCPIN